jgi:hypothetical protein
VKRAPVVTLDDKTYVPITYIYTMVGSCVASLATICGAVWYVAAFSLRTEQAQADIGKVEHTIENMQADREIWKRYLIKIDSRLGRIEGRLRIPGGEEEHE